MKKKINKTKKIPLFHSETEESQFWDKMDSTKYFSNHGNIYLKLPSRTTTISLRLPKRLLDRLRRLADLKDVPYQSLLKVYLDKSVGEEIQSLLRQEHRQ